MNRRDAARQYAAVLMWSTSVFDWDDLYDDPDSYAEQEAYFREWQFANLALPERIACAALRNVASALAGRGREWRNIAYDIGQAWAAYVAKFTATPVAGNALAVAFERETKRGHP